MHEGIEAFQTPLWFRSHQTLRTKRRREKKERLREMEKETTSEIVGRCAVEDEQMDM